VGKSGVLEHKSGNISETRKGREKVIMEGLQEFTNTLSNRSIPDPIKPPLPSPWGSQLPPQNPKSPVAITSGTGEATDFIFGQNIQRIHPLKTLQKRERGRIQGLPIFFGYLQLSREWVKLRTSNFVRTFIGSIGTKAH